MDSVVMSLQAIAQSFIESLVFANTNIKYILSNSKLLCTLVAVPCPFTLGLL